MIRLLALAALLFPALAFAQTPTPVPNAQPQVIEWNDPNLWEVAPAYDEPVPTPVPVQVAWNVIHIAGGGEAGPTPTATATPTAGMSSLLYVGNINDIGGAPWNTTCIADCYLPVTGTGVISTTAGDVESIWTTEGSFTNFQVVLSSDIGGTGDNFDAELYVNGGTKCSGTLSCSIAGGGGTETSCSMDTDSCTVTAGDRVQWKVDVDDGGTLSTSSRIQWTVEFQASTNNESQLVFTSNGTLNTAAARYHVLNGTNSNEGNLSYKATTLAPISGDITGFDCHLSADPTTGGSSYTFTVYESCGDTASVLAATGGGDSKLECVISAGSTDCTADAETAAFDAGAELCIRAAPSGSPAAVNATCGMTLTGDNAEFVFTNITSYGINNNTYYHALSGNYQPINTTAHITAQSPVAFTPVSIYAHAQTAPGAGSEVYTVDLWDETDTTNFSGCTITGAATTCNDVTEESGNVAAGDEFSVITTQANSPANPGWFSVSVGASIP